MSKIRIIFVSWLKYIGGGELTFYLIYIIQFELINKVGEMTVKEIFLLFLLALVFIFLFQMKLKFE